jgi:hypothetical protein
MYKLIKEPDKNNKFDLARIELTTISDELSLGEFLGVIKDFLLACGFCGIEELIPRYEEKEGDKELCQE